MSKNALVVALAVFAISYGTNVSTPYLVLYRDRLDLGANQTQLIFVVYVAGILFALLLAGQISDRIGRRLLVMPSLILSAIASGLLILGRNDYNFILAGRVLLGIASGAAIGVGAAWLLELMGKGNEARAAIVTTVVTYAGFGLGPPVSAVYESFGPAPLVVPYVVHIVFALAMVPVLLSVPETVGERAGIRGWKPRIRLGIPPAARRPFLLVLAPVTVFVFAFPSVGFSLFPVLVSDALDGGDVLVAGLAGAITAWGGLIARPVMNRIEARAALKWGMLLGACGYVLGMIANSSGAWALVWPAAFALGGASGILSTACLTLIGQMTDDENRGALSSTFYLIAYTGMATPLLVTALGGVVGITTVLIGLTVVAVAAGLSNPARRRLADW